MTTEATREMYRGDSLIFESKVSTETGAPYNLTNAKLWLYAKYAIAEADSVAAFKCTNDPADGIEILDAALGKIRVTVAPSKTAFMPDADCTLHYALKLVDGAGVQLTIEAGTLLVKPTAVKRIV